jgi:hypothetical protein
MADLPVRQRFQISLGYAIEAYLAKTGMMADALTASRLMSKLCTLHEQDVDSTVHRQHPMFLPGGGSVERRMEH